jgi:hypothetical protein
MKKTGVFGGYSKENVCWCVIGLPILIFDKNRGVMKESQIINYILRKMVDNFAIKTRTPLFRHIPSFNLLRSAAIEKRAKFAGATTLRMELLSINYILSALPIFIQKVREYSCAWRTAVNSQKKLDAFPAQGNVRLRMSTTIVYPFIYPLILLFDTCKAWDSLLLSRRSLETPCEGISEIGSSLVYMGKKPSNIGRKYLNKRKIFSSIRSTLQKSFFRLSSIGRNHLEMQKRFSDIGNFPFHIVKILSSIGRDLQKVRRRLSSIGRDLQKVRRRLSSIGRDLQKVRRRVSSIGRDLQKVRRRLSSIGRDLQKIRGGFSDIGRDLFEHSVFAISKLKASVRACLKNWNILFNQNVVSRLRRVQRVESKNSFACPLVCLSTCSLVYSSTCNLEIKINYNLIKSDTNEKVHYFSSGNVDSVKHPFPDNSPNMDREF